MVEVAWKGGRGGDGDGDGDGTRQMVVGEEGVKVLGEEAAWNGGGDGSGVVNVDGNGSVRGISRVEMRHWKKSRPRGLMTMLQVAMAVEGEVGVEVGRD